MNWTADEFRQLRYRLGWSRAELARNLGCEIAQILEWESVGLAPGDSRCNRLLLLLQRAEMIAENVQRRPVAEVLMKDRGLAQIHENEVIDCLANGAFKNSGFDS